MTHTITQPYRSASVASGASTERTSESRQVSTFGKYAETGSMITSTGLTSRIAPSSCGRSRPRSSARVVPSFDLMAVNAWTRVSWIAWGSRGPEFESRHPDQ